MHRIANPDYGMSGFLDRLDVRHKVRVNLGITRQVASASQYHQNVCKSNGEGGIIYPSSRYGCTVLIAQHKVESVEPWR